jgi:predicted 3-demethylubiquinone-9 3-methyltransferase (glyoxalase superfamily)
VTITGATPYLWFDRNAEDAANFYVSIFPNSRIESISHYLGDAQLPKGTVLVAALNGGPHFTHSEAVSFQVLCDTQDEIDHLWTSLSTNGGEESMCGWCKDRFGVSWQIVPRMLNPLLQHSDDAVRTRAWDAMVGMRKLVIADFG